MREVNYLKAIVIVHGKSEKQMCDFIKLRLRLKIQIESEKNGERSIQITSLKRILRNNKFINQDNLLRYFEDIEIDEKNKIKNNFRIFIIMDTDDCNEQQKEKYINKEMFKDHWAYDYIVPIYNSPELETVLTKAGIKFSKEGAKRKKEYVKIFPTDDKYISSDVLQIEKFAENLKKVETTNMEKFIKFCIDNSE